MLGGESMSRMQWSDAIEQQQLCLPVAAEIDNPHYHEYLKLAQKRWMFSDLLMMNKEQTILTSNQQKIKVLNLLYHSYKSTAEALKAFYLDRKPELFDAHVGESACQIRAVKLAVMLKEINIKTSTEALVKLQTYEQEADRIYGLLYQYKIPHNQIEGKISLKDFYAKYSLDAYIQADYLFLVVCYVLYTFKHKITIDINKADTSRLSLLWTVSRRQSENIINAYQKVASFFSIDFVLDSCVGDDKDGRLLLDQIRKDDLGRWLLSTIITMKWMLNYIKNTNIECELQLCAKRQNGQFYHLNSFRVSNNSLMIASTDSHGKKHQPKIIIQGFVDGGLAKLPSKQIRKKLNQLGLQYIVLVNAASHRQYPLPLNNCWNETYHLQSADFSNKWLQSKLRQLRHLEASAMVDGLCKSHPNIFGIAHIFCSTI